MLDRNVTCPVCNHSFMLPDDVPDGIACPSCSTTLDVDWEEEDAGNVAYYFLVSQGPEE